MHARVCVCALYLFVLVCEHSSLEHSFYNDCWPQVCVSVLYFVGRGRMHTSVHKFLIAHHNDLSKYHTWERVLNFKPQALVLTGIVQLAPPHTPLPVC